MTRDFALALVFGSLMAAIACSHTPNPTQPTQDTGLAASSEATAPLMAGTSVRAARNSEQLVFSGVAAGPSGPVGFWIWCEVESENPYAHECNGAMYFYALGLTKHVEDQEDGISEGPEGVYQIKVQSTLDNSVSCTLKNGAPPVHGPQNTVTVDCTTPSVHAVTNTAVVNVTGPHD